MNNFNSLSSKAFYPYLLIARPDHWVKNIFVFPGIFIALIAYPSPLFLLASNIILGLVSVCTISSANYVINEWSDREFDKYHPTKKDRPAVQGQVSLFGVVFEYHVLALIGLSTGFCVSILFGIISVIFLLMGLVYNVNPVRAKDLPYLDVLTESINNPIRLCLGWLMVTSVVFPPSSLMLGYWFSGAFLMAAKRLAEYRSINDSANASSYRISFKWYNSEKLNASCLFYAMAASFFLGVFFIKYKIELIIVFPFLLGLFALYLYIALRPESVAQKPECLFQEKQLMKYVALLWLSFLILLYSDLPFLDIFVEKVFTIN